MIRYTLSCDQQHRFEGWFPSSDAFEKQAECGQIACPHCTSRAVTRAPMAPQIVSARRRHAGAARAEEPGIVAEAAPAGAPAGPAGADAQGTDGAMVAATGPAPGVSEQGDPSASAAQLLDAVGRAESPLDVARALRRYVEGNARPVGERFADLALSMHRGEIADANIYGSTTKADREMLADEGVPIQSIPWVPLEDA